MDNKKEVKEFDWDTEFGKYRGLYRVLGFWFKLFMWIPKLFLKRKDTLATDDNINPDYWNDQVILLRRSYETAFTVYAKSFMFDKRRTSGPNKRYNDREDCYRYYYNSLNQKCIRFLIDLLCTLYLEDTIYRELFNMFFFEFQYNMNKYFNPEIQQKHVLYCNYMSNDEVYYQLMDNLGKSRRMSGKYDMKSFSEQQKLYNQRKAQLEGKK